MPREDSEAHSRPDRAAVARRRRRAKQLPIGQRRARLIVSLAAFVLVIAVIANGIGSRSGVPGPPAAAIVDGAGPGDPFAYRSAREADFIARATAGNAHVLFSKSPGGAVATAARVAAFRPAIDRAVAGTGIDPNLLEGLVFVESAGRADALAGSDPASAAGLTQILAATGQSMLGMHIDLAASRRLLKRIAAVENGARGRLGPLLAQLRAADERFSTTKALAATVRYLETARHQFGRTDLAIESYHMGIGNLHQVLSDYDGGAAVPYAQLYFDSSPGRHAAAFRLMAGFSDDSVLYYWRVLGAVAVMHLYRTDRAALERLASLQTADDAGGAVLQSRTPPYGDPAALSTAYRHRELVPLPSNAAALGIGVLPSMGSGARAVGAPPALYRGLRPVALRLLIDLVAGVRRLSGVRAPLTIASTVQDSRYQDREGIYYAPSATGFSFEIERRYANGAQAGALQATLDRLQSLNLIAWAREPATIEVTVASDAAAWLASE
ncbi:MAG TPA: transglycosylase SLT domain-containing protein [Solirubrobacteraceae bacterium]